MIDFLLRTIVPQFADLQVSSHATDTYVGSVTDTNKSPFFEEWVRMIRKEKFWVRAGVGSFFQVTMAASLAACISTENTYYFDGDYVTGGDLYIHVPSGTTVGSYLICADEKGFSYKEAQNHNSVAFDPRIIQTLPVSFKADSRSAGVMQFVDQEIGLQNRDASLDGFIRQPIPGTEALLTLFDDSDSSYLDFYTGIVRGDKSTIEQTILQLIDKRRNENVASPNSYFDSTTYPSAPDTTIGKLIPDGYGPLRGIKAYPIDGGTTWKFAETATGLSNVWYKDDDDWVAATISTTDLPNGEFTTPDGLNASGNYRELRVNATLRSQVNPGDIIADLNLRYQGLVYNSTNYDTTEWVTEKAKLANVHLYMDKEKDLFNWIEALQRGSDYQFVYIINGDGTRTLRVADLARTPGRRIQFYYNKDTIIQVSRNFREVASKVKVDFDQDRRLERWSFYVDDTRQDYVNRRYGTDVQIPEQSLLYSAVDAQNRAEKYMDDLSDVRGVVTIKTHVTELTNLDLKLFDVIYADLARPDYTVTIPSGDTGDLILDPSGLDTFTIDPAGADSFTIGEDTGSQEVINAGRLYWGTITGIITEISFDPKTSTYALTLREVPV